MRALQSKKASSAGDGRVSRSTALHDIAECSHIIPSLSESSRLFVRIRGLVLLLAARQNGRCRERDLAEANAAIRLYWTVSVQLSQHVLLLISF